MSADTRPMTLPIVERLRDRFHAEGWTEQRGVLVNPDGPEAAETIEELVEALSYWMSREELLPDFTVDDAVFRTKSRALLAKLGGDS